jgi:hypothetical protein
MHPLILGVESIVYCQRLVKTNGTLSGLGKAVISHTYMLEWLKHTYVRVTWTLLLLSLSFFSWKVSLANWGSSLIEILNLETSKIKMATADVSKNLVNKHMSISTRKVRSKRHTHFLPIQLLIPTLKGRKASKSFPGQCPMKRSGLNS